MGADPDAAATGRIVVTDGVPTCDVALAPTDRRDVCWVDPITGFTFIPHRHNTWCCQILDQPATYAYRDILTSSSTGTRQTFALTAPSDRLGVITAGVGVLVLALCLTAFVALVTDIILPDKAKSARPVSHQVADALVGNSDNSSRA